MPPIPEDNPPLSPPSTRIVTAGDVLDVAREATREARNAEMFGTEDEPEFLPDEPITRNDPPRQS